MACVEQNIWSVERRPRRSICSDGTTLGSDLWYARLKYSGDDPHLTCFLRVGIAYCNSLDDDTLTLYLSTHLSSIAAISLKGCKDRKRKDQITANTINDRALKRKLQQLHQDHDRQENLGGLSVMKNWGLASMPDIGLISSCISFHPGDMPEYVTPSLEKSMVVFASDTSEDRLETFPWLEVPVVWDVITTQRTIIEAISDYSNVTNCTRSLFSDRIRAAALAAEKRLTHTDGDEQMETIEESCVICNELIPFEGLTEASCGQGHECSKFVFLIPSF